MRVTIKGRSGHQQELELFVAPFICDPLMAQPVDMTAKEFSHLAQLDLADNHDSRSPLEVDALIGSDLYWDILLVRPLEVNVVLWKLAQGLDGYSLVPQSV